MNGAYFFKTETRWINVGGGNIAHAELTEYDTRACVTVTFIGGDYLRLYLGRNQDGANDFIRWLNMCSMPENAKIPPTDVAATWDLPRGVGLP